MSVIHFGSDELGNVADMVAQAWTMRGQSVDAHRVDASKLLACISRGNTRAFRLTYGDRHEDARTAKACTEKEILACAKRPPESITTLLERAIGVVRLLSYNMQADDAHGTDCAGTSALRALVQVQGALLGFVTREVA